MEADWSVEIGVDLPRIIVPWSAEHNEGGARSAGLHFVDLREDPAAVDQIEEARRYPDLRRALLALNGPGSPFFTSKCDVFQIAKHEVDPDELEAGPGCDVGIVCFIDLTMVENAVFASFPAHENWLRRVVDDLRRNAQVRAARVDFVLRPATVFDCEGFGVTLYISSCGADLSAAQHAWEPALNAVLRVIGVLAEPPEAVRFPLL